MAPSILEGFGLPVIEAQFAGCRIICSDIPAFREVGGRGCTFVRLGSGAEERFAKAILSSHCETRPAPAQLPHLAPGYVSQQYMSLYHLLVASSKASEVLSAVKGDPLLLGAQSALADKVPTGARF